MIISMTWHLVSVKTTHLICRDGVDLFRRLPLVLIWNDHAWSMRRCEGFQKACQMLVEACKFS